MSVRREATKKTRKKKGFATPCLVRTGRGDFNFPANLDSLSGEKSEITMRVLLCYVKNTRVLNRG